ncbi:MAG: stage II sporulation protein D [Ruminococcus sp.]|nr:stage II sporulation protein D [Ruminococcus sp.]
MKTYIKTIAALFLVAAFLPLISLIFIKQPPPEEVVKTPETAAFSISAAAITEAENYGGDFSKITLYDTASGEVIVLTLEEYVTGAVFHEMPYTFKEEALKAQAVAARTYAVRKILENREKPQTNADIKGADVSNDFSVFQGYYTEEEAKTFYKEDYAAAYEKISRAVSETEGYIIVKDDEPIVAAFHAMSPGRTEYSGNVWSAQLDYLVPVISVEDTENVPLETEYRFTEAEFSARLLTEIEGISLPISPENWINILSRSESGTVLKMQAGDRLITGADFRGIFSLRSAVFDCEYLPEEAVFKVTVKGYGHAVGMSQYGANMMAKEGKNWREIVLYYYRGVEVLRVE